MRAVIVGGIVTVQDGRVVMVEGADIYGIRSDSNKETVIDFTPFMYEGV